MTEPQSVRLPTSPMPPDTYERKKPGGSRAPVTVERVRVVRYPRWVALANALVCVLAGVLIDLVLPQPFKLLLAGAGLSLGLLVFFTLSTAVLWRSPLSALQAPKSPST